MTDPLFVADLATLKATLRLSGVPSGNTDTLAILDEAILRARLAFYRRLGQQRVGVLLATAFSANPTTEDQVLRALANTTETKQVYVELLRKLPNQWMDASGDANRRWNEEAPFRERGPTEGQQEIQRLLDEIEEDMEMLAGEEDLGEEASFKTFNGTPLCTPPRPGDSIRHGGLFKRRLSED